MTFWDFLLVAIAFVIGSVAVIISHLIIPIIVIRKDPIITKKSTLWLLALASGLLGFIICAFLAEGFRGISGIIQSAFWVIVDYFIIKKKCYV
jgi:hypothetical protein